MGFGGIIGNAFAVRSLRRAVTSGEVPHAHIFAGAIGSGKTILADAFAKALLCENPLDGDSCGSCRSCKMFDGGNNPDVVRVRPEGKKSIGVDEARENIVEAMETAPYMFARKVFIVDKAETLTVQAQNALLKTLEEPESYGVFILLAEHTGVFLPTVMSRAVVTRLERLGVDVIARETAKRLGVSYDKARSFAGTSGGSLGKALTIAGDEGYAALRAGVYDVLRGITGKSAAEGLIAARSLERFKDDVRDALDVAALWYRDVAAYACSFDDDMIVCRDVAEDVRREAADMGAAKAASALDAVLTAKERLSRNGSFSLVTEIMILTIINGGFEKGLFDV